jgi:hypothetical protein
VVVLLPGGHRIRMHAEAAGQFALAETQHCAANADPLAERHFRRIEQAIAEELGDPRQIAEGRVCLVVGRPEAATLIWVHPVNEQAARTLQVPRRWSRERTRLGRGPDLGTSGGICAAGFPGDLTHLLILQKSSNLHNGSAQAHQPQEETLKNSRQVLTK